MSVLEKNAQAGGRARKLEVQGFSFDMGPSWYWMPDVFEDYFALFGKKVADYYQLERLHPSYSIFFGKDDVMDVPAHIQGLYALFEQYETGSSQKLQRFLTEAQYKYKVGMQEFVFKPSHSILEFMDVRILKSLFQLQMFTSISSYIKRLFKNPKLIQLLEFPVLFLGAKPNKTPAMYSLMNYADMVLGTWYPKGGMFKIIEGMLTLAIDLGVKIRLQQEVKKIIIKNGQATGVLTQDQHYEADAVVGGADYHHIEQHLLEAKYRNYSKSYWSKRLMAPSCLLFYLGINKKLSGLQHHNLFFDKDFNQHAIDIYDEPKWPTNPLFYVCVPSVTDQSVAPTGKENVFILIPLASDLEDTAAIREKYYQMIMQRLEHLTGQNIREYVIYKRSFAHRDFKQDYHAFKGNAYGLANTLLQTAFLKPKLRNRKVSNLFYAGQLTVPGPGVPPSLISGQLVANEVAKLFSKS